MTDLQHSFIHNDPIDRLGNARIAYLEVQAAWARLMLELVAALPAATYVLTAAEHQEARSLAACRKFVALYNKRYPEVYRPASGPSTAPQPPAPRAPPAPAAQQGQATGPANGGTATATRGRINRTNLDNLPPGYRSTRRESNGSTSVSFHNLDRPRAVLTLTQRRIYVLDGTADDDSPGVLPQLDAAFVNGDPVLTPLMAEQQRTIEEALTHFTERRPGFFGPAPNPGRADEAPATRHLPMEGPRDAAWEAEQAVVEGGERVGEAAEDAGDKMDWMIVASGEES
jgi:hypothetical protein